MSAANPKRRAFIGGLLAIGAIPAPTWADAGAPAYLSAAATPDGAFVLCGINDALDVVFRIPLPARGHAAAAHPTRPEAIAFARRPGTFAVIIDCISGAKTAELQAPEGRHFYGHGAFSTTGDWLLTTENDFEAGKGRIGVWDVRAGYKRIAEFDSGGIGPHDIKRLPLSDTFVIANGGIDTHPDTGRTKLNLPTMQSNLSYVTDGQISEIVVLPQPHQRNSMRHLAVNSVGEVAIGMQWQGDTPSPALVGRHTRGNQIVLTTLTDDQQRALNGYIGSIAFSKDGRTIATTSPRGNVIDTFNATDMSLTTRTISEDVCGIARNARGFAVTAGTGALGYLNGSQQELKSRLNQSWDNHLIEI